MGEQATSSSRDKGREYAFMKALLADLAALEQMIDAGAIERGERRIGAEQEMFLIDRHLRPAPVAPALLVLVEDDRLTQEIGRFNLEANLTPRKLVRSALCEMEAEIEEILALARRKAGELEADLLLTGILPTIRPSDLRLANLSPSPRYASLNDMLGRLRGGDFNIHIKGIDELHYTHDNVLLEACCTSFQVHLQVGAEEFASMYNLAQAVSAPLLAVAANSPLLLGHRLWHESRIALFQHSVDERSNARQKRSHPPRVSFGENWVDRSVLEIFREEIARFRVILTKEIDEDPLALLARGEIPQLAALKLHNGTVWRWNRPCYGIYNARPHLRIEARALPSGPTILDEMANAAFFFGLMMALPEEYGDITRRMSFDEAKANFFAAARYGLQSHFTWLDGREMAASELLLGHLLPLARAGLAAAEIRSEDRDRYLGTIEERVRRRQTGSIWALRSWANLDVSLTREQRAQALTAAMAEESASGRPVHLWRLAEGRKMEDWSESHRTVGQFMSTDLFTVRPDDLIDLAASVMEWKHVRHVPVEDEEGRLIGLVSHRDLLKLLVQGQLGRIHAPLTVRAIMKPDPVTVTPQTPTVEAIELMQRRQIGCLPVVEGERLVGILTAHDFLQLSAELIKSRLKQPPGHRREDHPEDHLADRLANPEDDPAG